MWSCVPKKLTPRSEDSITSKGNEPQPRSVRSGKENWYDFFVLCRFVSNSLITWLFPSSPSVTKSCQTKKLLGHECWKIAAITYNSTSIRFLIISWWNDFSLDTKCYNKLRHRRNQYNEIVQLGTTGSHVHTCWSKFVLKLSIKFILFRLLTENLTSPISVWPFQYLKFNSTVFRNKS